MIAAHPALFALVQEYLKDEDNELQIFDETESAEEIVTYLRKKGLPFYTDDLEMVPGSTRLKSVEKVEKFLVKPKKIEPAKLSSGVVGVAAGEGN